MKQGELCSTNDAKRGCDLVQYYTLGPFLVLYCTEIYIAFSSCLHDFQGILGKKMTQTTNWYE